MIDIPQMRISALRSAIQSNRVSFPSQTPSFNNSRVDIQRRLVELYFVRSWTCAQLARRYNLTRQRIEQLLAEWVNCAFALGYLQEIPAPMETAFASQAIPALANERRPLAAAAGTSFPLVVYAAGGQAAQNPA